MKYPVALMTNIAIIDNSYLKIRVGKNVAVVSKSGISIDFENWYDKDKIKWVVFFASLTCTRVICMVQ